MDSDVFWLAIYIAAFVLALNGFAELIGKALKEKREWKYATAIFRIGIGCVLGIIAAAFIMCS